ncbi:MAG: N-acetyl-gamma-glutamyl-phosphate reductase [Muribaculaceae bacterium]|nr:N-acetyl-gamma-glutamyl-phosphate reductase [Muribaculaceae bacterium]
MIKAGIIGGAGYTAGELVRLLLNHPDVEIEFVHSTSNAGAPLSAVHEGLIGETDLRFADSFDLRSVDVLFLCQGHGFSHKFWEENTMPPTLGVVDLAQDFRDESEGYVYGLPEVNAPRIATARKVANPGCFATAIQLALLPLAAAGLLKEACINGITGSTGAGVKPGSTTHYSWRTDNLSVYKPFTHQHLAEIKRTLAQVGGGAEPDLTFIPLRGNFARGIFVTAVVDVEPDLDRVRELYELFYAEAPFTHISTTPVDLKQVVNTNKCVISLEKHGGKLLVTSAIDNLLKGASGQAVENMNLMFGLDCKAGLRLKPSAF